MKRPGIGVLASVLLAACGKTVDPAHDAQLRQQFFSAPAQRPDFVAAEKAPCAHQYPLKRAFFGGLHVHTGLSYDAVAFGGYTSPEDPYRYATGGTVLLPPYDEAGRGTRAVRIDRPLDFVAVTDHAENLGELHLCRDPDTAAANTFRCRLLLGQYPLPEGIEPIARLMSFVGVGNDRLASVCGEDGQLCLQRAEIPWDQTQRAAEDWYDRSGDCSFTTFVGYEYSLAESGSNLHRNVIFANGTVPPNPLSAKEAETPPELWRWLQRACVDGHPDCDVISIPHNSNWSNGRMFWPEFASPAAGIDQTEAAVLRARFEVLAEIMQVKGDSECRGGLGGVLGSADEWCDFEKLRSPAEETEDCGSAYGSGGMQLMGCVSPYSYVRYALAEGASQAQKNALNPFKLGIVAASDTHVATPGATLERAYHGAMGAEAAPERRLGGGANVPGIAKGQPSDYNPGGLAGIWAQENTREALFAAMKRRETFGTSGTRIQPRFFAGADLPEDLCDSKTPVAEAYRRGVPMGGTLGRSEESPRFYADVMADPDGAPLQRLQMIKVVKQGGEFHQRVVDIAGGENGADVDVSTCRRSGGGSSRLCAVWQDPQFEPDQAAVYYLRALENPSCRWSTWECNRLPPAERPVRCDAPDKSKTVQERAWTSPVWYQP